MATVNGEYVDAAIAAILRIESREGLRAVFDAAKQRGDTLDRRAVRSFRIGAKVTFDGRRGRVTGTVTKVNRKTVHVREGGGFTTWRVSPSFLTEVE